MKKTHSLVWFRKDLRARENPALAYASHANSDGVIAVYFLTPSTWKKHHASPNQVQFILQNIEHLKIELKKYHIPLLIINAGKLASIPNELIRLTEKFNINQLFFNRLYEVDEKKCDDAIKKQWETKGLKVFSYHDQVILPPGEVLTQSNTYYTVFTPFKNQWYRVFEKQGLPSALTIKAQKKAPCASSSIPKKISGFHMMADLSAWPPGEQAALKRLKKFINEKIDDYDETRDFPSINNTSRLSAYLAIGVISGLQCFRAVIKYKGLISQLKKGAKIWLDELVWREFYKTILVAHPRVSMNQPFKLETQKIAWENNKKFFKAWCEGQTGYPIVDAAMRQLNQTGWMHNRLRMVAAMFLTKSLFIDWRWGERYFMEHLIDGDLAANNGGWQWAASTGTDAAPYFRIFNPLRQSKRFDPKTAFITKYCPELAILDPSDRHVPYKKSPLIASTLGYPAQIINHETHKEKVLKAFKNQ